MKRAAGTSAGFPSWMKAMQAVTLAVAVCFSLGATDAGSRFDNLSHRLMCTCGCNELLGECNHVGCPTSPGMRDELTASIASGTGDKEILASFAGRYGATVLAAPTTQGFDLVAWIAPFAVFAAALLGTILLVKRWAGPLGASAATEAQPSDPATETLKAQIRRETESGQ